MIRGLNRLGVENTSTFNIQSFKEHFTGIEGDVIVKQDTTVTADWTSISWDSISGVALSSFLPDANSTWFLFEVTTTGFNGAGLLLTGESSVSVNPITLTLSDTVNGQVYHYSDYFIPLEELTLNGISIDDPTDVYWAIRTAEADVEDWTLFSNTWNATNILNAVNTAGVKGLHLWFYGTRDVTLDIPNVSEISYYNHQDNIKFSEPIDDLAQEFDGVTQFNLINNITLDIQNKSYIYVITYEYQGAAPVGGQNFLLSRRVDGATPCYAGPLFRILGADNLRITNWQSITPVTNTNQEVFPPTPLKLGRNVLIIKVPKGADTDITPTQTDVWINGKYQGVLLMSAPNNGSFVPPSPTALAGLLISANGFPANNASRLFGNLKVMQIIDATGLTLASTEAYNIYNSGTARTVFTDSNDYEFDLNTEGASATDDSSNGYTITTSGGFTQTQFMD